MPSHHRVQQVTDTPGLHTELFSKKLVEFGYHSVYFGPQGLHPLFETLNFHHFLSNDADLDTFNAKHDDSHPFLWFISLQDSPSSSWEKILTQIIHISPNGHLNSIIIQLQMPLMISSLQNRIPLVSEILGKSTLLVPSSILKKHKTFSDLAKFQRYSILDISIIIFDLLELKRPSSWIGIYRDSSHRSFCPSLLFECSTGDKIYCNQEFKLVIKLGQVNGEIYNFLNDPKELTNLWDNSQLNSLKSTLLLEMLWAQFAKESMPMPRISGA